MSNTSLAFQGIWKKFTRGERFDSLRDLIPSMGRWLFSSNHRDQLQKKEFWALRDVSFELPRGEALAIIGPNGSGKTTALKLLSGILKPNLGSIFVKGRLGALIELGAGFHPDLTGRENIYLNGTILGMKRAEIERKFDEIVEFSGLSEFLDTPVKRYSSGMFARLGFSVACHVDPDILLVDEVLSVGDYHFRQKCFDKMHEFTRKGTSVVFISHDMTAVGSLCQRALVLRKGEMLFLGDVASAIQRYHGLYDEEPSSENVELIEARLTSASGEERDVFEPGEAVTLSVTLRAVKQIRDAHAAILIHSADGQQIFDTATSRLLANQPLNLRAGETARIMFDLEMNLRGGVFQLAFNLSSEIDVPGVFIFHNACLKRFVMTGQSECSGIVHLNPRVELILPADSSAAACAVGQMENVVGAPATSAER